METVYFMNVLALKLHYAELCSVKGSKLNYLGVAEAENE